MFTKILIANRGEIACRVAATAKRLGVRTVAVYSDADASAKHVVACDEAVPIGGNAPAESYLRWETIIAAAKSTGAQAIHPGYGFLSENDAFAQACADAGIVFIGPSPAAIRAMGLKAESKLRMEQAGVPLVPGYHGADQDPALLQREADRIGYPVLIKASAGGGGKGMRIVQSHGEFADALASCQREATSSFGNAAVLVEKYVLRPRHIEMQVFGDAHGNYVHLFERDCSVQRRHQKVLEEAPAPGMTSEIRQRMGEAAIAAARAVQYVGAGTVEFVVESLDPAGGDEGTAGGDASGIGAFYFMEMNTRLQVEHPVTEAITGLDLVEWQLRVASGERLPLLQPDVQIHGHAIEARICAEAPDAQFLPATGALHVYELPPHSSFARAPDAVRVDSGVRQGDRISPYYDSMVAKLIVHGSTRAQALARLDAALAATHIVGLSNNVQFLRRVANSESFRSAHLDTGLIPREAAVLFDREPLGLAWAAAAAACHAVASEASELEARTAGGWVDPWAQRDSWHSHGASVRRFSMQFHGVDHMVELERDRNGAAQLRIDAQARSLQWDRTADQAHALVITLDGQRDVFAVYRQGDALHVFGERGASSVTLVDPLAHAGNVQETAGRLTAPMPGKVVSFSVKAGDRVTKGQALAVMEAMKMEHTISAPADGVVSELMFAPGEQVIEGAELLRLELEAVAE